MKPINVFSMFDGMSCGQLALKKAGIPVGTYHASVLQLIISKIFYRFEENLSPSVNVNF